jgi:hypothetical protein
MWFRATAMFLIVLIASLVALFVMNRRLLDLVGLMISRDSVDTIQKSEAAKR